mgnify:FL=1
MATEIQPNRGYTMYQAFGDSLLVLDRLRIGEGDELITPEEKIFKTIELQGSATFKGSRFFPMFDFESLSLEQLTRTADGDRIYFPVDKPSYTDIVEISGSTNIEVRTGRYSQLDFMIGTVLEEDLIGDFFVSTLTSDVDSSGKGTKAKQYEYRLLLKSENGTFVSEMPAIFDEDGSLPYVLFDRWHPLNSGKPGLLYVPLEYQKVAPLEIMLARKT